MTNPVSSLLSSNGGFPRLKDFCEYPCWEVLSESLSIEFDLQHRKSSYNIYKTYWMETTGERGPTKEELSEQYRELDRALLDLISALKNCHPIARGTARRCIRDLLEERMKINGLDSGAIHLSDVDRAFRLFMIELKQSLQDHAFRPSDVSGRNNFPRDELVRAIYQLLRTFDPDIFDRKNKIVAYYIIETFSYLDEFIDSASKTDRYRAMDAAKHRQREQSINDVTEWVKKARKELKLSSQRKF